MKSHMHLDAAEVIALLKATLLPSKLYYETRYSTHPHTYGLVVNLNVQYMNELVTTHRNVAFLFARDTSVFAVTTQNRRASLDDLMNRQMLGDHTTEWSSLVSEYLFKLHIELAKEVGTNVPAYAHQNNALFIPNSITFVKVLIKHNEIVETLPQATIPQLKQEP